MLSRQTDANLCLVCVLHPPHRKKNLMALYRQYGRELVVVMALHLDCSSALWSCDQNIAARRSKSIQVRPCCQQRPGANNAC